MTTTHYAYSLLPKPLKESPLLSLLISLSLSLSRLPNCAQDEGSVSVALGTWLPHKAMKLHSCLEIFHPLSYSVIQASQDTIYMYGVKLVLHSDLRWLIWHAALVKFSFQEGGGARRLFFFAQNFIWGNALRFVCVFVYSSPDVC